VQLGGIWKAAVEGHVAIWYTATCCEMHFGGLTMKNTLKTIKRALLALGMAAFAATAQAEYTDDCITFSSAESFTLRTYNYRKNWDGTLWTSTDKTNWTEWNGTSVSAVLTGGTYNLYVRGNTLNTKITGGDFSYRWVLTGSNIACTGNIETLRGATGDQPSPTPMAENCYYEMFRGCALLTTSPALPATTLAGFCYHGMFHGCTALTSAPALPVTTLAGGCYSGMFSGCTSLTSVPELPATTLTGGCYREMFWGCTALTDAPALPATALAESCYESMFQGCTALTSAPTLPATTLADSCYSLMFSGCTTLKEAPALPAMTLADGCYTTMFGGCTALKTAPALPATTLVDNCYLYMFSGCASLTNAPALPATTLTDWCYGTMFAGCTSLTSAPALPAMTLAIHCYSEMFFGCSALTAVPELPAMELAERCYSYMFYGCTALEVNMDAPGKEWKIPATSTTGSDWGYDMFTGTKGTLQGQPELNRTYYTASAPVPPSPPGSKDNPWKIGAGEGDTVEAWTNGTTLVVQGAGKMMDFDAEDSVVPWPVDQIAAVEIAGSVTSIGQNAWLGLADSVSYNNLSATAAKTMGNGFGGTTQYARTAFREFLVNGASINATVALETAKSLTNEWTEVELTDEDVHVENGRIIIQHESAPQSQGFYLLQPTE